MSDGVTVGPVQCQHCGTTLDESPNDPSEERKPCPSCGSLLRQFNVEARGTVGIHASLQMTGVRAGRSKNKWFIKVKTGADLFRETGEWNNLFRSLDREKNLYIERFTSQTGAVLRFVSEKLTDHRDRGSAKYKRKTSK